MKMDMQCLKIYRKLYFVENKREIMKDTFRGYYRPKADEFSELWDKCIFSFDANILLNIYRYSPETKDKFLQILSIISDRIVVSHQAGKEYQKRRLNVIKDQEDAYDKIIENLNNNIDATKTFLNSFKKHPLINVNTIINDLDIISDSIEEDLKEKKESHPSLFEKDDLRDNLTDLLKGKIGKPFTPDEIKKIKNECKWRYANEIPPGFKDSDKKQNACGDLILWFQLLDIAKEKQSPLIFITDDKKEDWWWKSFGKTIGPRPELIEEMYNEAEVEFYMYGTDRFMEFALKKFLQENEDFEGYNEVMKEIKDVMFKDELNYIINLDEIIKKSENSNKSQENQKYILNSFNNQLFLNIKKIEELIDNIQSENLRKSVLNKVKIELESIKQDFNTFTKLSYELLDTIEYDIRELYNLLKNLRGDSIKERESIVYEIDKLELEIKQININIIKLEKRIIMLEEKYRSSSQSRLD